MPKTAFQPAEITLKFQSGERIDFLVRRVLRDELQRDDDAYVKAVEAATSQQQPSNAVDLGKMIEDRWLGYVVGDIAVVEDDQTHRIGVEQLPSDYVTHVVQAVRDFTQGRHRKLIADTPAQQGQPPLQVGGE